MNLKEIINSHKDNMTADLKKLIAFNSVAGIPEEGAYNGTAVAACLEEALKIAGELGFETGSVEGYAGYAAFGQGEPYVAVLGHLDVVPAGDNWTYDPFGGEIHDGKIYGRGTSDDKGPVVAALYGMKALQEAGMVPGSRVMLILGTSEETGGPDIARFVEKFGHPKAGFTPDGVFPVINAEKGIMRVTIRKRLEDGEMEIIVLSGGSAPNMVPDTARLTYRKDGETEELILKGKSAHGSTPAKGDNAIVKLFRAIRALDATLAEDMTFLSEALKDTSGEKLGIGFRDEESGELTVNAGILEYANQELKVTLDIRIPVTYEQEEIAGPLRETMRAAGFATEVISFTPPLFYPREEPIVASLMEVYRKVTGETDSQPIAIGGGTYAKAMKNVVAFGPGFPGREDVAHIADEYIFVEDLLKSAEIYAEAINRLSHL